MSGPRADLVGRQPWTTSGTGGARAREVPVLHDLMRTEFTARHRLVGGVDPQVASRVTAVRPAHQIHAGPALPPLDRGRPDLSPAEGAGPPRRRSVHGWRAVSLPAPRVTLTPTPSDPKGHRPSDLIDAAQALGERRICALCARQVFDISTAAARSTPSLGATISRSVGAVGRGAPNVRRRPEPMPGRRPGRWVCPSPSAGPAAPRGLLPWLQSRPAWL